MIGIVDRFEAAWAPVGNPHIPSKHILTCRKPVS